MLLQAVDEHLVDINDDLVDYEVDDAIGRLSSLPALLIRKFASGIMRGSGA